MIGVLALMMMQFRVVSIMHNGKDLDVGGPAVLRYTDVPEIHGKHVSAQANSPRRGNIPMSVPIQEEILHGAVV